MYLFKTLKSLSKYSKQLTRSSQQLNAVPHQTISNNIINKYGTNKNNIGFSGIYQGFGHRQGFEKFFENNRNEI